MKLKQTEYEPEKPEETVLVSCD